MTVTATIPQIWAARVTHFLDFFSAFTPNATREWEGEARIGNTVKIPTQDRTVTLSDYSRTTDLTEPAVLTTSTQDLEINQAKTFNFALEDLDARQNAIPPSVLLDNQTSGGAEAMAKAVDGYCAGLLRAITNANLAHATAAAGVSFDLNYLADVRRVATSINQPRAALVQIMPPELVEKIDDAAIAKTYGDIVASQLIAGSVAGDPVAGMAYVGVLGQIRTFVSNDPNLRGTGSSNTVPTSGRGDKSVVYVYDPRDFALVVQVSNVEAYRPERRFSTAIKGLTNYGARVLNAGRMQRYVFTDA